MHINATREELPARLRESAAAIEELAVRVDLREWRRRPAPGEWSLTEIACHLRDVEREVNFVRLRRLAEEDGAFLPAADTDPLAKTRAYQAQDGPAALADFLETRLDLVAFLESLPEGVWSHTARHALFGTTAFTELASLILEHDQAHVEQIQSLLTVIASSAGSSAG